MYQQLISKLLSHKNIGVFSHIRPDGDCLGSQIALCQWLKKNGINARAFNEYDVTRTLEWLTEFYKVEKPTHFNPDEFDAFVFVDGNALHRFGKVAEKLGETGKPLYMIDHHPDPEPVFNTFVSDTNATSTCEMVFLMIEEYNVNQVDEGIAKALYTGVMTDTGSFQFDSVKPVTFRVASELISRGKFTPNVVAEKIYSSKRAEQLQLMSMVLGTIELHENQQIATMYVTKTMFDQTRTVGEDTEGFVQYPLSIHGVKACVFFREEAKDSFKISLRSRSKIDTNKWARKMNGGGHRKASGAHYEGPLQEAIKTALAIGKEQL